ncbi:MAG: hypothetical protein IKX32_01590 [Bacteroidales bacterium]|nr:hypothetical protein [Bacteroidales bacterium]
MTATFGGVQRTGTLDLEGWWYSSGYRLTNNVTNIAVGEKNTSDNYSLSSAFYVGSGNYDYPMGMTYYFHNDEYSALISPAIMTFPIAMQKM